MSDKDDREEVARLERLNEELSNSLKRCHKMLRDYEVRLTANSNDAKPSNEDETREA